MAMLKTLKIQIIFGLVALLAAGSVLAAERPPLESRLIRVAIIKDASSLRLKIKGSYKITDSATKKVLSQGRNIKTTVTAYKEGILLAAEAFNNERILITASDPDAFMINDRNFRGSIEIIKNEKSSLLVVNHIDLEDYIKGILYHESSHYWPQEALKAQAVVCRTYALYQTQKKESRDYDLTNDIYSQVYGGRVSERFRTNRAVEETVGQVIFYAGKILPAFYHATCGGHTEDAAVLWDINSPPLKGVTCDFCKESPHYQWHNVLSKDELVEKMQAGGYKIKDIGKIILLDKDRSGRYKNLKIISATGQIDMSVKDFRNVVGPNEIKSAIFQVKIAVGDIVFEGFGWGHGVGLCQWGAYFMAKEGYQYREILKYYYPESYVKALGL